MADIEMTRRPEYTAEEFARDYAEDSMVTIELLSAMGRHVEPCDCDYEGCRGWQMVRPDHGSD